MMFNLKVLVFFCVPTLIVGHGSECPKIINRAIWGARPAYSTMTLSSNPAPFVIVHHSDTPTCTIPIGCKIRIQQIQEQHMTTRGWEDVGYNFLIGGEGTIYEGRGWGLTGAHAKGWNSRSIGICLLGNLEENNPSAAQLMSLESLIACGVEQGNIISNYSLIAHSQTVKINCPGKKMFRILKNMPNFNPSPVH